jgi:hypothetical protein
VCRPQWIMSVRRLSVELDAVEAGCPV